MRCSVSAPQVTYSPQSMLPSSRSILKCHLVMYGMQQAPAPRVGAGTVQSTGGLKLLRLRSLAASRFSAMLV